jgi:hypothetical protein
MTWINLGVIDANKNWQYSPEFSGEIIRLRHELSGQLPYGANGLIAQTISFDEQLELYNVRKIYPFYGNDIFVVTSPFSGNQRLLIRGQVKYTTGISWIIYLDLWTGESNFSQSRISQIEDRISSINNSLLFINQKLDLLLTNCSVSSYENDFNTLHNLGFI